MHPTGGCQTIADGIGVRPDSVQVSGGRLFKRLPTQLGGGSLPVCIPPGTVARRGSKGDCPARSSTAHLAVPVGMR
jgi:hypothetical protein